MGVRERKKEKKESKEEARSEEKSAESKTDEITEQEVQPLEGPSTTQKEDKTTTEPESRTQVVEETPAEREMLLPTWGSVNEYELMYHIPTGEDDRDLWADEWGDFLLEWAQKNTAHKISLVTFITEQPFSDIFGKVKAFRLIAEKLVDKDVAEWVGRNKGQLRIYWRPIEDWADIIYAWSIETGKTRLDVKTLVIQESSQDFASLPEDELKTILGILVEQELAEWVDKKRAAIRIRIS
ncbi:hypothetical protein EU537_01790 [Candidatus Thorarchaeota archaeon]|nr:MAG: hypothetical protein EU537_01790 [Candidatus Thorarchaeota archaeon]